jgi:hypothetical protein
MTDAQRDLWQRLQAYAFDEPGDTITFLTKLCRENGWSTAFAERAMEEYRRYCFLAATAGEGVAVSPSDVVDQVWHLHLMYTRRYFGEFCPSVLGFTFHHEPNTGNAGQATALQNAYDDTLRRYRERFGEPPADLWPPAGGAVVPRHRRVDTRANFVVPVRVFYGIIAVVVAVAAGAVVVAASLGGG